MYIIHFYLQRNHEKYCSMFGKGVILVLKFIKNISKGSGAFWTLCMLFYLHFMFVFIFAISACYRKGFTALSLTKFCLV